MDDIFNKAETLASHVKEYVDNRVSSVKLTVAEKTSALAANIIAAAVIIIVFLLFLVFASTGLAYALSGLTGKVSTGFLIVACIYLFAGIIVWAGKEKIIRLPVLNSILKLLFKEDDQD